MLSRNSLTSLTHWQYCMVCSSPFNDGLCRINPTHSSSRRQAQTGQTGRLSLQNGACSSMCALWDLRHTVHVPQCVPCATSDIFSNPQMECTSSNRRAEWYFPVSSFVLLSCQSLCETIALVEHLQVQHTTAEFTRIFTKHVWKPYRTNYS